MSSKLANKKEQKRAIQYIPVLFDIPDFDLILRHLDILREAKIDEIKIGEKLYMLTVLISQVQEAQIYGRDTLGEYDSKAVGKFLADKGITRGKISPHSKYGFCECMMRCIEQEFEE